jgi:hypothetical protein
VVSYIPEVKVITITWDWFSFFTGVFATITVAFWMLVFLAFKQWKKQKRETVDLFKSWKSS